MRGIMIVRASLVSVFAVVLCLAVLAGLSFAQTGGPSRALVVAVVNDPPMAVRAENGVWKGFCVDLWRHVAKELGVNYEMKEMTFREIEGALGGGQADLSVIPMFETAERERFLDFSTTIGTTQMAIAVLSAKDAHPFLAAMKIFFSWGLVEFAFLFLSFLFLVGFIFWIMEKKHNPEHFGGHPVKGISAGIYWVGSTLVSGVCTGVSLKSTPGRIIGLVWILAGAVAFSALTAALASTLIERQQLLSYTYDVNAMRRMRLGAIAGAFQASILERLGGNYTLFDKADEGMEALFTKKIDGFLSNERLMEYEEEKYRKKLSVHLTTLRKMKFGFVFPANSPLRERVNVSIMGLMESPEWEVLANHYGLTRDLEPLHRKGRGKTPEAAR
jgi:polar amino acid transport system substrate-binding protein